MSRSFKRQHNYWGRSPRSAWTKDADEAHKEANNIASYSNAKYIEKFDREYWKNLYWFHKERKAWKRGPYRIDNKRLRVKYRSEFAKYRQYDEYEIVYWDYIQYHDYD